MEQARNYPLQRAMVRTYFKTRISLRLLDRASKIADSSGDLKSSIETCIRNSEDRTVEDVLAAISYVSKRELEANREMAIIKKRIGYLNSSCARLMEAIKRDPKIAHPIYN